MHYQIEKEGAKSAGERATAINVWHLLHVCRKEEAGGRKQRTWGQEQRQEGKWRESRKERLGPKLGNIVRTFRQSHEGQHDARRGAWHVMIQTGHAD